MSKQAYGYVCFALILQAVVVYGQSERCYFCNTEVHGQGCNDPIQSEELQIQSCSDSEIVAQGTILSKFTQLFGHHASVSSASSNISARADGYPDVCIYMTYQFDSRNISARGCESNIRLTNVGELEICNYYSQIIPVRITNFNCAVCTDNLCNHANFNNGNDTDGEPGSSQTILISLKLIVAALLVKVLIV